MNLQQIMRVVVCAALAALGIAGAGLLPMQPVAGQKTESVTLHGEAALNQLKQTGQYESLKAALNQARFSVSRAEQTPLGRTAWHAANPAAGYDAYVTETGVSIIAKGAVNDTAYASLSLYALGYGTALRAVGPGQASGDKQSISIERDGLREWFVNSPDGLEHGFTLSQRPDGKQADAPLRLALQVGAGWRAVAGDGQRISLHGPDNQAIEYGKLSVRDDAGRAIPARLAVADEQVVIEVEDGDAAYPLTIDPLFTLQQRLLANDGRQLDLLGYTVALSGNTALMSAPGADLSALGGEGAAYVFVRNGGLWTQQAKLVAADGVTGDFFGVAVALDGDTALIGATHPDQESFPSLGAAYVFVRNGTTWTQQQKLTANEGMLGARFGAALALDGNTALIGAPEYKLPGTSAATGAAFVFTRSGTSWTQQARLRADDGAADDQFGAAVALDGNTALIGAPKDTVGTNAAQGSVYVFTRNGTLWEVRQQLTHAQPAANDQFGNAVALSGDKALVGAYLRHSDDRGAVYVFEREAAGWLQIDTLEPANRPPGAHFGVAVALAGSTAVIGASPGLFDTGTDARSVYVFMGDSIGWSLVRQFGPELGSANDGFGYGVAVDGDTVLAGGYRSDAVAIDQGAAYAFVLRDSRHLEEQKLTAHDGQANTFFGHSVALSGDTLAAGASLDRIGTNNNQGSVYVFTRSGASWAFQQKITANDGAAGDVFGTSVALEGNTLVVGASDADIGNNRDQGAAYVFLRSGANWTFQQKLFATGTDGRPDDYFGGAVSFNGATLAVGAWGQDSNRGGVYLFTRGGTQWTQQQRIFAADGEAGDNFGGAVALHGETLAVGAYGDDIDMQFNPGSAYVFTRSGTQWALQKKLTAASGTAGEQLGYAVALHGDTLAVGAPGGNFVGGGVRQGTVYVFARSGVNWTQAQFLNADADPRGNRFGHAVALSGDTLAAGAPGDNSQKGATYVYTRFGNWLLQQKLTAGDGASNDFFGQAVALSGASLAVGARNDAVGENMQQGSAYVFAAPACPALTLGPVSLPNGVLGTAYDQTITLSGATVPSENLVTVSAGALPPGLRLDKNDADGLLRGTPTAPGTYRFTITLTHTLSACPASREYTLTITPPCPAITLNPPALPGGNVGMSYSQTLTANGGTPGYSFSVNPVELPNGLTLSANGTLSGTPTSAYGGGFTVTATDANGCRGTRFYSFTVNAPPTITAQSGNARQGSPASRQAIASVHDNQFTDTLGYTVNGGASATVNGVTVSNLSATRFNVLSADVAATCAAANASFTLTVTDDFGLTANATLNISVSANSLPVLSYGNQSLAVSVALTINPASGPSDNGSVASIGVQSQGTFTGSLSVNNTTGVINVSNAQPAGSHTITIRATDNCGATRDATFTLSVNCPAITLDPAPPGGVLPGGTTGASYQQTITATGGVAPHQFSVSAGALPAGLSLSTGGALTGTPGASGVFNFTVKATDANGCAGTRAYTLTVVCPSITINQATLPNGTTGVAYNQTLTAAGGTAPYSFTLAGGALPSGVTLAANGGLTGTPGASGAFNFTVKATDANGCAGMRTYTLNVVCPSITINPASLSNGTTGTAYNQTLTAVNGSAPYTFAVSNGSLPAGLTLTAAGALSGTPTASGSFNFTVTATDANGCMGNRAYTLAIAAGCPSVTINPATVPTVFLNIPYSQTLTASGGAAPYTFSLLNGVLQNGLTLSAAGVLSGTVPVDAGSVSITVKATDANGCTGQRGYTVTVMGCPAITVNPSNATLPVGQAGQQYNQTFTQTGGNGTAAFTISAGALPDGLSLSTAGVLSGAPTAFGNFNFTVKATDAGGCMGTRAYSLTINPPCATITVNPASLPNGTVGTAYNQTATATGGTAPYTYTISAGSLPGGLNLASGGALTGTPNAAGTFNFTIKATDANGCLGTRAYSVTVTGAVVNNGLQFYPLPRPVRILDTRAGQGNCDNVSTPITGGTSLTTFARLTCEGISIPANAQAIVGNLTIINQTAQIGYLTIFPDGQAAPLAANMIYEPGGILANNFTVGLSANGNFNIFGERTIDAIVDISGYYAPPAAGGLYYHPLSKPVRLLDTRAGQGNCDNVNAPINAGTSLTKQARIACEGLTIPASAQAIVGNATAINVSGQTGYLTIYPNGVPAPLAGNIVYFPGQILANAFTVSLSATGEFNIFAERQIDMVIDVAGYYSSEAVDANGAGLLFNPLATPVRILDTRAGEGNCDSVNAPISAGTSLTKMARMTCEGQLIPNNAQAVIGNVTIINQTAQAGYLTLYPTGQAAPLAANMIYQPGQILSNAFVVGLSAAGQFNIFAERTLDAVVDVSGFFAP